MLPGSRGRSTWPPAGQVAELAVRDETGEMGLDVLSVESVAATGEHAWDVTVAHADGRRWRVGVTSEETGIDRAESCGKALVTLAPVVDPALSVDTVRRRPRVPVGCGS